MSPAVFIAFVRDLLRDRGSLVMVFVLPVAFFLIFAMIFADAGSDDLILKLAVADPTQSEASTRLVTALDVDPTLSQVGTGLSSNDVRTLVAAGDADVGLIVQSDPAVPGDRAPLLVVVEPAQSAAAGMLMGRIQEAWNGALGDVAIDRFMTMVGSDLIELTDAQQRQLDQRLAAMREQAGGSAFSALFDREDVAGTEKEEGGGVTYYAGAIMVMFLLFTTADGAVSIHQEREAGILTRFLAGPAGVGPLIDGRFLFLTALGLLQGTIIFVVAWLGFGVALPSHLGTWAVTTLVTAAAASGVGLALAAVTKTRRQAQGVATITVLILSALGGSMVPRFMMPPAIRELGWLTPNGWAVEAYTVIFWRDGVLDELWLPWAVLAGTALVGWALARAAAAKRMLV